MLFYMRLLAYNESLFGVFMHLTEPQQLTKHAI